MIRSLQVCRAWAALMVVCFHAAGNLAKPMYFGELARSIEQVCWFGGQAGVAFFFVLSGFIISHAHHSDWDKPAQLGRYLWRRAIRIYPTYWMVFFAVLLGIAWVPSLRAGMDWGSSLYKAIWLLPQELDRDGGYTSPVLIVGWSLQYELAFYLAFAAAIVNRFLFFSLLAGYGACLLWRELGYSLPFPFDFLGSQLILLFLMGMLVDRAVRAGYHSSSLVVPGLMLMTLTIGAAISTRGMDVKPLFDLAYGLSASVLICGLAAKPGWAHRSWVYGIQERLGDASYALYLMHFPLISVFCKLAVKVVPISRGGAFFTMSATVAACAMTAMAFHIWVERPVLEGIKRIGLRGASQSQSV